MTEQIQLAEQYPMTEQIQLAEQYPMTEQIQLAEQYQSDLLAAGWRSPTNYTRIRKAIGADSAVFTDPHVRWLWDLTGATLDSTSEMPSSGLVAQEAALSFKGEEYGDLILTHAEILKREVSSPHAVIAHAVELGELHRFKQSAKKLERLLATGKYSEAKSLMESHEWIVEATKLARFRERRLNHGYDDYELLVQNAQKRRDDPGGFRISTSIRELDEKMDGGPALGEMTLLIGWTGRGKSTLAVNLVDSALRQGKGGLFLPSEMRDELITAKIWARSVHMKQNDVYTYRFTPEQEKAFKDAMELRRQRFSRLLMVEQLGTENMDRETIMRAINDASEYLADFSWIVIDTLDHCQPLPEYKRDKVGGFGANANWVSSLTDTLNVASFITTQSNRQGATRTELEHAANHSEGIRVSQNAIAINHADLTDDAPQLDPTDDFEEMMQAPTTNGAVVLSVLKCRLGETGDVHITTDLACSYMGDRIIDAYEELGRFSAIADRPLVDLV